MGGMQELVIYCTELQKGNKKKGKQGAMRGFLWLHFNARSSNIGGCNQLSAGGDNALYRLRGEIIWLRIN